MSLLSDLVAIADDVTKSLDLQADVTHEAFVSQTGKGDRTYGPKVVRPAIVTLRNRTVVTASGELRVSNAQIVFLDRTVIVTDNDRITMPDGKTQKILERKGFIDKETGRPVLTEIFLG